MKAPSREEARPRAVRTLPRACRRAVRTRLQVPHVVPPNSLKVARAGFKGGVLKWKLGAPRALPVGTKWPTPRAAAGVAPGPRPPDVAARVTVVNLNCHCQWQLPVVRRSDPGAGARGEHAQ